MSLAHISTTMDEYDEDKLLQLAFISIADAIRLDTEEPFLTYPMVHPQPRNDIEQDDRFGPEQVTQIT